MVKENGTKKIAFLHRYGLGGWICCGGHCIPRTFDILVENGIELHYFGPRSADPTPEYLTNQLIIHQLPYCWDRSNPTHKWSRTLVWYIYLPWLALRCRLSGMDALIYIDDTLPMTGWIFRILYGKKFAMTAMDFFVRIYTEKHPILQPLCNLIEWLDFEAWKRTPVLFTKVYYTQTYLKQIGVPDRQMFIARNPLNTSVYHPLDTENRSAIRKKFGFDENDIVLSHHGILHPNKGNDWIIERIAQLKDKLPRLKFLLAGNGPDFEKLNALAKKRGLQDRIVFTGWIPTEKELNEALNAADIGLVMRVGQETDHFHMTDTLTHEMACGKPILAVNLKGIAEVIEEEKNGLLFSPDDPREFCEKLINLYNTPDIWRPMGKNALTTIIKVSNLETCANQLAGPILNLVAQGE